MGPDFRATVYTLVEIFYLWYLAKYQVRLNAHALVFQAIRLGRCMIFIECRNLALSILCSETPPAGLLFFTVKIYIA